MLFDGLLAFCVCALHARAGVHAHTHSHIHEFSAGNADSKKISTNKKNCYWSSVVVIDIPDGWLCGSHLTQKETPDDFSDFTNNTTDGQR